MKILFLFLLILLFSCSSLSNDDSNLPITTFPTAELVIGSSIQNEIKEQLKQSNEIFFDNAVLSTAISTTKYNEYIKIIYVDSLSYELIVRMKGNKSRQAHYSLITQDTMYRLIISEPINE